MTNATETSTTTPRDINAEFLALHGSTIERGSLWRIASMPDQSMRIEAMTEPGENHMTIRTYAKYIAGMYGYKVGKFLGLTYVQVKGVQQTRRVYELSFAR